MFVMQKKKKRIQESGKYFFTALKIYFLLANAHPTGGFCSFASLMHENTDATSVFILSLHIFVLYISS